MILLALVAVLAGGLLAQTPPPTPAEMLRGREDAARVGALVEAGALPRASLEQARREREDAEDLRVLERTLYGDLPIEELTEQQAEEMLAAATRRVERRQARVDQAKRLVEEGALARLALTPYLEELDRCRREMSLAASRARVLQELAAMARAEQELLAKLEQAPPAVVMSVYLPALAERHDGSGQFRMAQLKDIAQAFELRFSKALPVSARGDTAVHRALGYDHRGRVDVAVDPDHPEGVWLRDHLRGLRIPFFAFRGSVAGRSTGPHIHIGPPSGAVRGGGG
ncbi:MAG: hypothetical protein FJW34_00410 [Acidobacteria bacterium]|nr:hypothetical protein [Acidobacteriota bacterium]